MYDLLVKDGRVIDPAQNIDDNLDLAIKGEKIALVAKDIPSGESHRVVDARGKIVVPGLIDLHCHACGSIIKMATEPDIAGIMQGVTTVVDGGSVGEATFGGFSKYVIPSSLTRVFCFLHLASQGQSLAGNELRDAEEINSDAIVDTIESNRDVIKGIKLRLVGNFVASAGIEVVKLAKSIAKRFSLPTMVHAGDINKQVSPTLTKEVLPLMESGDILTHIFSPKFGRPYLPDGTALPELWEAMERGVVLDTGQGLSNFSFEVAKKSMAQGILPTTLSTDLVKYTLDGPTYGLTVTMSIFMALGLDLKQIVAMTTINPARVLKEDSHIGSLKPGMEADVSILEIKSGKWKLEDSRYQLMYKEAPGMLVKSQTLDLTKLVAPSITIKSGQLIPANLEHRPQPVK